MAHQGLWSDALIILFASYWEYVVLAVFLMYLWSPKSRRVDVKNRAIKAAWGIVSAVVARLGVVSAIRFFWPTTRPFVSEGLNALINQNPLESSFPSGHAAFFMALAIYFLLTSYFAPTPSSEGEKRLGWFLIISALFIGSARVAAGVHWPSDVLAGWLVGVIVGALVFKLSLSKMKQIS